MANTRVGPGSEVLTQEILEHQATYANRLTRRSLVIHEEQLADVKLLENYDIRKISRKLLEKRDIN